MCLYLEVVLALRATNFYLQKRTLCPGDLEKHREVVLYQEVRVCANYNDGQKMIALTIIKRNFSNMAIEWIILQKFHIKMCHFAKNGTIRVGIFHQFRRNTAISCPSQQAPEKSIGLSSLSVEEDSACTISLILPLLYKLGEYRDTKLKLLMEYYISGDTITTEMGSLQSKF